MSVFARQERLRRMLGEQQRFIFQLFVEYREWPIFFDLCIALMKKHELDFSKIDRFDFPKQKIGPYEFDTGYLAHGGGEYIVTQCLYTSFPYGYSEAERFIEADSMVVKGFYKQALAKAVPWTQGQEISKDNGRIVTFQYRVHHVDPRLFPQQSMGCMMPITAIPGETIKPPCEFFVDFPKARLPYLPLVSERGFRPRAAGTEPAI